MVHRAALGALPGGKWRGEGREEGRGAKEGTEGGRCPISSKQKGQQQQQQHQDSNTKSRHSINFHNKTPPSVLLRSGFYVSPFFPLPPPFMSITLLPSPSTMTASERSSTSPDAMSSCEGPAPPQPRKPIPRKGHTKSRRGCFNCKRRRIKCNERHPHCNHCIKAGLQCEYPANIIQTNHRAQSSPSPHEVVHLRSTPGMFVSDIGSTRFQKPPPTHIADDYRLAPISPLHGHCLSPSASRRRQGLGHRSPELRAQCMFFPFPQTIRL